MLCMLGVGMVCYLTYLVHERAEDKEELLEDVAVVHSKVGFGQFKKFSDLAKKSVQHAVYEGKGKAV